MLEEAAVASDTRVSFGFDEMRRAPAFARAAKVLELLEAGAALREAWAVFADTDEVGGPDTRIDLSGDSKVACVDECSDSDDVGT